MQAILNILDHDYRHLSAPMANAAAWKILARALEARLKGFAGEPTRSAASC